MKKILEPVTGVALSFFSYEQWENLLISLAVALIGGFLAAMGKDCYYKMKKSRKRRIEAEKHAYEKRLPK